MKRWVLCALMLSAVARPAERLVDSLEALSTELLLARAADYAQRFERSMATVVLEERYVQIVKGWRQPPREPDRLHLAWSDDLSKVRPDDIVQRRRQMKSDVLLVQLPDQTWAAFRDTFEVNGRLQRNRDNRLRDLFLQQTQDSHRQLRRINETSAKWNLGGIYRDINLPTTVLLLIHPRNQRRFTFRAGAVRGAGPAACRVMSFTETSRPTVVRSSRGRDAPLSGDACLDAGGVVSSTRLDLDPRYTVRGAIEVTYRPHERVDVLVPDRMWEWYVMPQNDEHGVPLYVEAMATYSNLRHFTVTTSERVK